MHTMSKGPEILMAFDGVVTLDDSFSNKVIIIDLPLIAFQLGWQLLFFVTPFLGVTYP